MEAVPESGEVPCVLFAFNRPRMLVRVLSALRQQGARQLVAFVDGPRDERDQADVQACRNAVRAVDWASLETHFHERNRGLPRIIDDIDRVFEDHEQAVFIEDDCLPMPGFVGFMAQALARYRGDSRVFSIGGYQPIRERFFRRYPFAAVSTARFVCWGWACWRERWCEIHATMSEYGELFNGLRSVPDTAGADLAIEARRHGDGVSHSWDTKVALTTLWHGKVHLLPTAGLVRNIGLDAGMHAAAEEERRVANRIHNRNVVRDTPAEPKWPDDVTVHPGYAKELRRFVKTASNWEPRTREMLRMPARLIRRLSRSGRARRRNRSSAGAVDEM